MGRSGVFCNPATWQVVIHPCKLKKTKVGPRFDSYVPGIAWCFSILSIPPPPPKLGRGVFGNLATWQIVMQS